MDKIDRKILQNLQDDARITMTKLSHIVGLSKTPCLERVRRLEASGVIRGYHALLDPEKMDAGHVSFVQVTLDDTTSRALNEFNEAVRALPAVQACHMIAGGFDYLLKVRTDDIGSYRHVLGEGIAKLPHVQQTSTFVVMETVLDSMSVPVSYPERK
jgi:Lrp/AsnC family transcriptional regulator, leucine-responsive regulatory protein